MTEHTICYELLFDVKGLSKPSQALTIQLIRIIEKTQQLEADFRVLRYDTEEQKNKAGVAAIPQQIMKEVLTFIK